MRNVTRMCAAVAIAAWLPGCSAIYVGNVKFTSVEICSEEYATRLHPHSGCLPPTRAENAQSLFLARYRLPVSDCEACNLTNACKDEKFKACPQPTEQPKEEQLQNLLPSLVGRIFKADPDEGERTWQAPTSGDIEFIAVGDMQNPPHKKIPTEILVKTDISGVVQKKLSAGVELNAKDLVNGALVAAGMSVAGADKIGLTKALENQVLNANFGRSGLAAAKGAYYYVSIRADELDRLMSAFWLCNWYVDQRPGHRKTTDVRATDATRGDSATGQQSGKPTEAETAATGAPLADCVEKKLKTEVSISEVTRNLIGAIQPLRTGRPDIRVIGLVIGVAIAQTVKGQSELCTHSELGLIQKGQTEGLTANCDTLRALVNEYKASDEIKPLKQPETKKPPEQSGGAVTSPAASPGSTPDTLGKSASAASADDQAKALISSLSASYARASFRALDIASHTSVLAIHWVPIRIPDPKPDPK